MFWKVEPNKSLNQSLLLNLYQLDPKINIKQQFKRDLKKPKPKIKIKSMNRTGSTCTNTKIPHAVATKYEEQETKR